MADAKPELDLLRFLNEHYAKLKDLVETDKNDKITAVIVGIDTLFNTITTTGDISHDEIVKQLNALKTLYNGLGLQLGEDITSYTRYIDANDSLNMIVVGFNEVEAGVEGEGEKGSGAGETGEGVEGEE